MTQLDDGRQMREAMPYEISYLQVRSLFACCYEESLYLS
jgi:hypothetical protein